MTAQEGLIVLRFSGNNAIAAFEQEAGGHRIQRVPPTEKRGRKHSSTVTVATLAEPSKKDLKIDPKDLKFETFRASGPGGQHRNKSDTAVRVTHLPTGIQASSSLKSQARNKSLALSALRAKISGNYRDQKKSKRNTKRRKQIGKAERSDKIRTIAYQRNRVENHLNGKRMKISRYERGFLEELH